MRRHRVAVLMAALGLLSWEAHAHDWYPLECCSGQDCGPAETVERRPDGSYLVTSRGLSAVIPPD